VILVLGGLGVLRAVADLVTALRLREVSVRHEVLHLTPEREAGVAGYSAGLADYDGLTDHQGMAPPAKAKHRADAPGPKTFHEEVLRSTMDLDAKIAQAGVTGTGTAARLPEDLPPVPDTPAGVEPAKSLTEE
jgi:hypothetical protein